MKKVLIITYYWPPSGGGGVQRWVKFVKYLQNFGWEPVVFTPENPEVPVFDDSLFKDIPVNIQVVKNRIWEPYSFYKKFTGRKKSEKIQTAFLNEKKKATGFLERLSVWIRGNLFIPDARKYWIKTSVRDITGFLDENSIDVIVTTGPPHSAHMIGLHVKRITGITWLADFRDPWTNIDYYKDLKLTKRSDRIHHKLEKQVLTEADGVSVISPGMVTDFMNIVKREYRVIPNGYDSDDVSYSNKNIVNNAEFSLAHIGSLTKTRNPVNLWNALSSLVAENEEFAKDLEIHNIGKIDINAVESLNEFGLTGYLNQTDYLSHDKVIAEQHKATLLLLLINDTPNAKLILTGKIFEYLISGTPIICIAPTEGDAAKVISDTNSGTTYDFDEVWKLKNDINKYYLRFKNGETLGTVSKNVERYERKNLTGKMADYLNDITG